MYYSDIFFGSNRYMLKKIDGERIRKHVHYVIISYIVTANSVMKRYLGQFLHHFGLHFWKNDEKIRS